MAKTAKQTPAIPDGFARVQISKWDDDSQSFVWQAKDKHGTVHGTVHGKLYINVPITVEAQEVLMEKASSTFTTDDGKVKVTGHAAPAARKFVADLIEPIRGEVGKAGKAGVDLAHSVVQQMLDEASPYSGRGGSRSVSKEQLAGMSDADRLAYLTAKFVK